MKTITQSIKVLILALVLAVGISYVSAWTGPTATPPAGNTDSPINVGTTAQIKNGGLSLNSLLVSGQVSIVDGTQGSGKVLTSDANGVASWAAVASGGAGAGSGVLVVNSSNTSSVTFTPTETFTGLVMAKGDHRGNAGAEYSYLLKVNSTEIDRAKTRVVPNHGGGRAFSMFSNYTFNAGTTYTVSVVADDTSTATYDEVRNIRIAVISASGGDGTVVIGTAAPIVCTKSVTDVTGSHAYTASECGGTLPDSSYTAVSGGVRFSASYANGKNNPVSVYSLSAGETVTASSGSNGLSSNASGPGFILSTNNTDTSVSVRVKTIFIK